MSPNLNALPDNSDGRLDLSPAQRGIWYAQQLAPENPMYQLGQFVDVEGPLEVPVLAQAVTRAIAETDALNMAFGEDHAGPFQRPRPNAAELVVTDLTGADDPEAEARVLMDADLGLRPGQAARPAPGLRQVGPRAPCARNAPAIRPFTGSWSRRCRPPRGTPPPSPPPACPDLPACRGGPCHWRRYSPLNFRRQTSNV